MATSYTKESKPTTTFTKEAKPEFGYLKKQDTFYLLLETGDKIVLTRGTDYTKEAKP